MAIIMADGLFNGKRLRACSDKARLLWPYLFLASNGFGRLEIDYEYIIRNFFVDFRNPPKSSEFFGILKEYHENGLLFLYECNGVWGQWDCKSGSLPRYQTSKDRKSPAPDENAFNEWKKASSLKTKTLPIISEIFGKFPLGIGIGIGIGIGEEKSVPTSGTTPTPRKRFTAPTPDEVRAYGNEIEFAIDAEKFCDFYAAKGWVVGKSPMKDWRAAVRTWRAGQHSTPVNGARQQQSSLPDFADMVNDPYHGGPGR